LGVSHQRRPGKQAGLWSEPPASPLFFLIQCLYNKNMADLKNVIYDTTIRLITKKGFEKATVDEICKTCNITKKTFYSYYPSKDYILLNFYREMTDRVLDSLPVIIQGKRSVDRLWRCQEAGADIILEVGPEVMRYVYTCDLINRAGINTMDNNSFTIYQRIILEYAVQAQANGEIRKDVPPQELMRFYYAATNGISVSWIASKGSLDLKKELRRAFELLFQCDLSGG
jgi:AcrR family transcriptional regulator